VTAAAVTQPKLLRPHAFAKALADAGIVHDVATIRRIVIDAAAGQDVVMLYVERFGDERLLDVALTLDGVEVCGVPKEPADG
jgi:hypothetical protein